MTRGWKRVFPPYSFIFYKHIFPGLRRTTGFLIIIISNLKVVTTTTDSLIRSPGEDEEMAEGKRQKSPTGRKSVKSKSHCFDTFVITIDGQLD